jgi:serine/threonine protein kinase
MKRGQLINGYLVIGVGDKDFSTKGSGLSMWTFVRKEGVEYFMKEFLSPTFPILTSPGSAALKERRKNECEKFESHHLSLISKVSTKTAKGSNLISTLDFFRYNAKYYKVTEKVEVSSIETHEISTLPFENKLQILHTLTASLAILHELGIVHGDLKPNNILIKNNGDGLFTSKLIDFDNCYSEAKPPIIRDEIVGDPYYYSPELENYVRNVNNVSGADLTLKSDIFALGIVFCQYLTGCLPVGILPGNYASTTVNNGSQIKILNDLTIPIALVDLINLMFQKSPSERPSIQIILQLLSDLSYDGPKSSGKGHLGSVFAEQKSEEKTTPKIESRIKNNIVTTGRLTINMPAKKHHFKPK